MMQGRRRCRLPLPGIALPVAGLLAFAALLPGPGAAATADSAAAADSVASEEEPAGAVEPTVDAESPPALVTRDLAPHVDVEAEGRLFARGLPVTDESFSPDGFHFAYLYQTLGGWLKRRTVRCTHLLDLGSGENRAVPTPKGAADRIGGWDATGRYLLIESLDPDFFASLTGGWTTYHWIFDAVTSEFVSRKNFTGRRDERRFLWKNRGSYHGVWDPSGKPEVTPLYEGELSQMYREREKDLQREDERRRALAGTIALGHSGPERNLAGVLQRLDDRWTRRGQRDPIVSELYGDRPALWALNDGHWVRAFPEVDFVAVLDRRLCLVTATGGSQYVLNTEAWEILPIAEAPEGWVEILDERWTRTDGFYDESDPLPRDMQYLRTYNVSQGTRSYFNYVLPDRSRLMTLYSRGPADRVLRIVELPESWRREP